MNILLIYFLLALSLSTDAFFLSLSLSTSEIAKKEEQLLCILIGLFHFVMSFLGNIIGHTISKKIMMNTNIISAMIFLFLALETLLNNNKKNKINKLSFLISIIIAVTVSLDSFNTGVALGIGKGPILIASTMFMIISSVITLVGFYIGNKANEKYEKIGKLLGTILLLLIAIKYLKTV